MKKHLLMVGLISCGMLMHASAQAQVPRPLQPKSSEASSNLQGDAANSNGWFRILDEYKKLIVEIDSTSLSYVICNPAIEKNGCSELYSVDVTPYTRGGETYGREISITNIESGESVEIFRGMPQSGTLIGRSGWKIDSMSEDSMDRVTLRVNSGGTQAILLTE
ncbi:MAG: hypothetical protein R3A11_08565 [Bdellovibrionota bacterium]